jgi:hypothetical protein
MTLKIDFDKAFESFTKEVVKPQPIKKTITNVLKASIDLDLDIEIGEKNCINCGHNVDEFDFGTCYHQYENDNMISNCDCRKHYYVKS